ncbi:MAG: hypothetical protein VR73_14810 [Gammaproteobacteria bacterium BRH_c0]|nr:MAG: hypothetical protein VR73_14810 [Gammaproteobacteria bacterium BRH_c0]
MVDGSFLPILDEKYQVALLYVIAIFVGLTGIFGFLSGQPFMFALANEMQYPKAGSEKDDESRALGMSMTLVYLIVLMVFVIIKYNS